MIFEKASHELGVPFSSLSTLAKGASYEYKEYSIKKKQGGLRLIQHPSKRLKGVQRWILTNVLPGFPVHERAAAYVKSRTIQMNATQHVKSRYLLRMDFKDFFPSIKEEDFSNYLSLHKALTSDMTEQDIAMLCAFVFRFKALTIGAPTSPMVSNILCFDLDSQLTALAKGEGLTYSRYADDLFFSSEEPNRLQSIPSAVTITVGALSWPAKLKINESKTRHSSKRGSRHVTGVVLGSDGLIHLGRKKKRHIRALINTHNTLDDVKKEALVGYINQAVSIEPNFIDDLILKYGAARIRSVKDFRRSEKDLRIPQTLGHRGIESLRKAIGLATRD